ncbi:MAG TPA: hypothetical protein VFS00_00830 [Polyangiaceae bacterium]|nr:hypothetical protein [Polyangiaceae bacterium]
MAPADVDDGAWLLARERGEAAPHPDPERARGYERLERALAQPPTREPPADFEADLFAALERAEGASVERSETHLRPEGDAARRAVGFTGWGLGVTKARS